MIIDDITIKVKAGNGGNGAVSFRREKYVPKGGPDGGNGGMGANVFIVGVSDFASLNQFRNKKEIKADDGENGSKKKKAGHNAEDIYIRIPVGTNVEFLETNFTYEVRHVGETYLIARGGKGGVGNYELRSSSNTTPREAEPGHPGQEKLIRFNLQFIASIGFIGLPNGGKSSLLNALTNAEAKIGDYPFTTLEPNLGDMDGTILADIPGLIEGASDGKGLGIKFLKHIEKTRLLVHCIDITSENIKKDYMTIRKELEKFSKILLEKKEIILLTKIDLVSQKEIDKKIKQAKKLNPNVLTISVIDESSVKAFKEFINNIR